MINFHYGTYDLFLTSDVAIPAMLELLIFRPFFYPGLGEAVFSYAGWYSLLIVGVACIRHCYVEDSELNCELKPKRQSSFFKAVFLWTFIDDDLISPSRSIDEL